MSKEKTKRPWSYVIVFRDAPQGNIAIDRINMPRTVEVKGRDFHFVYDAVGRYVSFIHDKARIKICEEEGELK